VKKVKHIRILGRRYRVLRQNLGENTYGDMNGVEGVIIINPRYKNRRDTLVHEVVHGILHESGLTKILDQHPGLEEALVTTLESGLCRSGLVKKVKA